MGGAIILPLGRRRIAIGRRPVHHVTGLSGGGGSWLTANVVQRELLRRGDRHTLLFTDVLYEDADAYRFLVEGALQVFGRSASWVPIAADFPDYRADPAAPIESYAGNPAWREFLRQLRERAAEAVPELVWLVEGRDPWEVYRDERFLGNSGVDPCSKILKRQMLDRWCDKACDRGNAVVYFGIGSAEAHRYAAVDPKTGRLTGIRPRLAAKGWIAQAPLIGRPEGDLSPTLYMRSAGIEPPRLYGWAAHNNCGGMCCKAGLKHWRARLAVDPGRYAYDALMERKIAAFLGQRVTFLEDRRGGGRRPLSLIELAERQGIELEQLLEADETSRADSGTGCGCMVDELAA